VSDFLFLSSFEVVTVKRKNYLAFALALILALGLVGCGLGGGDEDDLPEVEEVLADPEYPVSAGGATIYFRPARVISLAPSLTEKIYDLGHHTRLVGISDHQGSFPPSIAHIPSFGIATMPDIDGILAVNPHLVFSVSELPADAMSALAARDIPLVILPSYAHSLAELEAIYLDISTILDGRTTGQIRGDRFVESFRERLDALTAQTIGQHRMTAVYLRTLDFTMATGDTLEGELLERLGFENIAADQTGWVFDPEHAAGESRERFSGLEVIFLDENYISTQALSQSDFWQGLGAVTNGQTVNIDSQIFERQSLRIFDQLEIMAGVLQGVIPEADDNNDEE